jgi:hypothetical protein
MSTRDEAPSASALVRLLVRLRQQLAETARECGHAMFCYPHPGDRTERK